MQEYRPAPSAFDKLMLLPLLQGITRSELLHLAGRVRFSFRKEEDGTPIALQDATARSLIFLLGGHLSVTHRGQQIPYSLSEDVAAPHVIEPESLFGLQTRYVRSYVADGPLELLEIEKAAVRDVLLANPTFRLSYLNYLCRQTQRPLTERDSGRAPLLSARILSFVRNRCLVPRGPKMLHIHMTALAREVDASRLNTSLELHRMEQLGLLTIGRGKLQFSDITETDGALQNL